MKALTKTLAPLAMTVACLMAPSLAQSKMIEDGSAFSGLYRAVQPSCAKSVFDLQTGETNLVFETRFEGTPQGLKVDGRLQAIQSNDLDAAQPNSGGTINAAYLSPTEFLTEEVIHFESENVPVIHFSNHFSVDPLGLITETRVKMVNGQVTERSQCQFTPTTM